MRIYYIAQETLLNAPWWPEWGGSPKSEGIYVCVYIHVRLIHCTAQ